MSLPIKVPLELSFKDSGYIIYTPRIIRPLFKKSKIPKIFLLLYNMLHRQDKKTYDLSLFDLYEIKYRIKNRRLEVLNPSSNRYVAISKRTGKQIINDATWENPDLLYYRPPAFHQQLRQFDHRRLRDHRQPRQRNPVEVLRIPFRLRHRVHNGLTNKTRVAGMTAKELYDVIHPLTLNGNRVKVNVNRGDNFESINNAQTIFTEADTVNNFKLLVRRLTNFLSKRLDYLDENPIILQVLQLPKHNPPLRKFKDGVFNCACLPVLEYLKTKEQTTRTKNMIKKVEALNEKYLEEGIDDEGLQLLAKTAHINISAIDSSRAVWREYRSFKNAKTFIYYAHEKHFTHLLVADADNIDFNFMNKGQTIQWMPHNYNYDELNAKFVEAHRICSKGNQVALITPATIYKSKFYQFEEYSDCYTDGGVGKTKFLEQVPHMKTGISKDDPFRQIYFDADVSGFYSQHSPSDKANVKYDHNHSYKSALKCSPANFAGFPILEAVFKVDKLVSESQELITSGYHGLLYIDYKSLTADDLDKHIYYESAGWYPIEIVKYFYDTYQVDPLIKAFAYASTTFNVDFSKFSNSQFRCFVGKTVTKDSTMSWRTTDKYEYLRALYVLKDKVLGVNHFKEYSTEEKDPNNPMRYLLKNTIYEVEYKTDRTPWQCPVISAYVKAHQKVVIFNQYNKLIDNGITPVCVRVDGIEIHKDKANQASKLFDIGTKEGQWKLESIKCHSNNTTDFDILKYNPREVRLLKTPSCELSIFNKDLILPNLVHFSGAGGNGKTNKLIELKKIYPNLCISAPTHEACDVIEQRGKENAVILFVKANTYHRVFGVGCHANIPKNCTKFAIDECSMLSEEDFAQINLALQKHFNNFTQPFGGAQIILFGDFWQLPCVSPLTPLYNTWTGIKAELYTHFTEIELTKNYRQDKDPEFFALCNSIRAGKGRHVLTKNQALQIIRKLNTRVNKKLPNYSTLDDMYIAGINAQTDIINKQFSLKIGSKVICQKTCKDLDKKKVPNGKVGIVVQNIKNDFQVRWADNSISKFKSAGEVKKGKGKSRFKPAVALTVHKSQGKTLKRHVIINPSGLFERNHLYVALTRATKFESIYLTEPITFDQFIKTVYVEGYSKTTHLKYNKQTRLHRMVAKYKKEEPGLTVKYLTNIREKQCNKCCYCSIPMGDTFGYNNSITLERISNDKLHILTNIKLACFKCNSSQVGQR